jgi:hypothetical protein
MAALDDYDLVLHKIRVKLYPNHLQHVEGNYIARTSNEKTLTTEDILVSMNTRGRYTGSIDDAREFARQYEAERAFLLLDGFAVSNDWCTMYINIGGAFESPNDAIDPAKHPITFRIGPRQKLKRHQGSDTTRVRVPTRTHVRVRIRKNNHFYR